MILNSNSAMSYLEWLRICQLVKFREKAKFPLILFSVFLTLRVLFNGSFFKSQSQVIIDYLTLSKTHAPSFLKILNDFGQHTIKNS